MKFLNKYTFMIITGILGILCVSYYTSIVYNVFSKKKKKIHLNKSLSKLLQIFPLIFFIFSARLFFYEPFTISSNSMLPTLLEGDYVIVQKFSCVKNNINDKKIEFKKYKPVRNDVIVFQCPYNTQKNYIKRVIGIPGDTIMYHPFTRKICIIKNKNIKYTNIFYEKKKNKTNKKTYPFYYGYNSKNISTYRCLQRKLYREKLCDHIHHIIVTHGIKNFLHKPYQQYNNKTKWMWIIPKDKYFVMGDNRDQSSDSRFWGLVSKENILGKARYIWFNVNYTNKNWLNIILFNRIFKKIQ